jgi:hypothetical protein
MKNDNFFNWIVWFWIASLIASLGFFGGLAYIIIHFLAKVW